MANLKKILIIDDDLTIRFVLKKILTRQLSNVDIFSSEDGVQGVGYAFVLRPDLIIIDSTLPKYSGRELVDFISSNDSFKDTPIILLHEDDSIVEDLPSNFIQRSKASKLFPEDLVNDVLSEIGNVDDEPHNKRSFKFLNFLSRKIISYSNSSFINARQSKKGNAFRRLFHSLEFLFNQILSGFYLTLFYMLVGRKEAEVNIEQKKKDESAYRARIYPAVGASVAITLFIVLHLFITLGGIFTFGFFGTSQVAAASYTWDGGGATNNWSDCDNWSTNICPVAADSIIFNGTSTKDSVVDIGFAGTVTSVSISAGYNGTVSLARSLNVSTFFTQASGFFNSGSHTLDITSTFTLSGGDFTASSGNINLAGNLTITGGTFNHNNGTFTITATANRILSCNNIVFNQVALSNSGGTITINSNCSIPLGNNPNVSRAFVLEGTISGSGTMTVLIGVTTVNTGGVISGFSGINLAGITISGSDMNFSTVTSFVSSGTITLSSGILSLPSGSDLNGGLIISGGTFNAPSGTMTVAGALTISGTPTFNHNNGTVTFDGTGSVTISCNNVTFNLVSFNHTSGTRTVSNNCSLPLGSNPLIPAAVILSGNLSGTGTLTTSGAAVFTLNTGGTFSGFTAYAFGSITVTGATVDFSSASSFTVGSTFAMSSGIVTLPTGADLNGALTISGGTFDAPNGNMYLAGALTISGAPTFNHNGGTIIGDGSGTWSCNNVVFNLVQINFPGGSKTINSTCNLPLGNNPITSASIILNGTLSGTGLLNVGNGASGTFTLNSGALLSGFSGLSAAAVAVAGASLDLSSYTSFTTTTFSSLTVSSGSLSLPSNADVNNALTISGGTFNSPGGNLYLGANFTVSGASVFNHNNGTIIFDGVNGTLNCNNVTFNSVVIAHTSGTKTVQSNCNLPLGSNPTTPQIVTLNGTLTGTGTYNATTLNINAGGGLSGFTGLITGGTFTVAGGTVDLSSYSTYAATFPVVLSSGTLSLPNNADLNSSLTIAGGTFNAPSGDMSVASNLTISGSPVFNHNNGKIIFDGASATLSCNNVEFNLVELATVSASKVIQSSCTLPLGNDPVIPLGGSITLNGKLTGSGNLTKVGNLLVLNAGSELIGFDGLSVSSLTVSGANADFTEYSVFEVIGTTMTLSSGSLTLSNDADINASLTVSGGTLNAPSGSMYLGNNVTFSGSGAFNHNNGKVILDGSADTAITCNNVAFNLVVLAHTGGGVKTINSSCILPLGNNPVITGRTRVNGGSLTGSGTLTAESTSSTSLRLDAGATLVGFTGLIAHGDLSVRNNTILDLSSYDPVIIYATNASGSLSILENSSVIAPSGFMDVYDNFAVYDTSTFVHNNGTVRFNVLPSLTTDTFSIIGSTTFNNLTFDSSIAGVMSFTSGTTQIIQGTLKLRGTEGKEISLVSETPSSQWNINPQGNVDIQYLSVQDSNNTGPTISAAGRNITDLGNNTGWSFNAPGITNVGPSNLTNGSFTTDNTPTFTFDISDLNISDTVQYTVQMDNSSDFATPEVNYTSSLESQGSKTYTVSTPLLDGEYYMRIRGVDQGGGIGGYNVVNSGNVAFKVDATAPTATLILGHVTDSTNPNIYIISSVSDTFGATQMIYSEKSDFSDAQYISFRQTAIYSLSSGFGTKRIYVKYKDAAGNESATYSSTINYTETVQETVVVPDVTPDETDPEVENPDIEDEGSIGNGVTVFALRLLDGNKNPLQNVTIKLVEANLEASTDVNGIAVFNQAPIGKQQLLGVYNNQEFIQEIEISDDNKVITIVLDNQGISPIVVVGLVSVIAVMGGVIFYLIKRKKITTN